MKKNICDGLEKTASILFTSVCDNKCAFTISFTIIAQILIMLCYREQWIFWLILDIASCITFALIKKWAMFAMYICWTLNCIYGWWEWRSYNEKRR